MDETTQTVKIHGPYEDAIIAGCELAGKVMDGQDAATRKEIWTRWLEITKPLHDVSVAVTTQITSGLLELLRKK